MFSPRWSPDGRYIAALTSDERQLWFYSFESARWQQLPLPDPSWLGEPTWSHDGRSLYVSWNYTVYKFQIPDGRSGTGCQRGRDGNPGSRYFTGIAGSGSLPTTASWSCATAAPTNSTRSTWSIGSKNLRNEESPDRSGLSQSRQLQFTSPRSSPARTSSAEWCAPLRSRWPK